jgi:hypothetical protein
MTTTQTAPATDYNTIRVCNHIMDVVEWGAEDPDELEQVEVAFGGRGKTLADALIAYGTHHAELSRRQVRTALDMDRVNRCVASLLAGRIMV